MVYVVSTLLVLVYWSTIVIHVYCTDESKILSGAILKALTE